MNLIKKTSISVFVFLMISVLNAQARYSHVPRVKVDGKKAEKVTIPLVKPAANVTPTTFITDESTPLSNIDLVNAGNTSVASTSEEVMISDSKATLSIKHHKVVKSNKKSDRNAFTKRVKEKSKLMEVKDVKKSLMAKWVLFMLICFGAALLFGILAAVFLYGGLSSSLYIVFAILSTIAFIGGIIFLILGLMGVM